MKGKGVGKHGRWQAIICSSAATLHRVEYILQQPRPRTAVENHTDYSANELIVWISNELCTTDLPGQCGISAAAYLISTTYALQNVFDRFR